MVSRLRYITGAIADPSGSTLQRRLSLEPWRSRWRPEALRLHLLQPWQVYRRRSALDEAAFVAGSCTMPFTAAKLEATQDSASTREPASWIAASNTLFA
jgi:hypothetical protein